MLGTQNLPIVAFMFPGGLFTFNGTVWCLVLVWGASAMRRRLRTRPSTGATLRRAAGVMFVGLGVKVAVSR